MKEIIQKYKSQTTKLLRLFENIYSWMPVASVIDDRIFVTHGGISDITDLKKINRIQRNKVRISRETVGFRRRLLLVHLNIKSDVRYPRK